MFDWSRWLYLSWIIYKLIFQFYCFTLEYTVNIISTMHTLAQSVWLSQKRFKKATKTIRTKKNWNALTQVCLVWRKNIYLVKIVNFVRTGRLSVGQFVVFVFLFFKGSYCFVGSSLRLPSSRIFFDVI